MKYKKRRRGFTLVELIVVLVILAVLAALLVPALTGYIDKAQQNSVVAETRMILQAVQTETSELYGSREWKSLGTVGTIASESGEPYTGSTDNATLMQSWKDRYKEIVELAEVPSLTDGTGQFFAGVLATGQVRILLYNDGKGHICLYHIESGKYEVFQTSKVSDSHLADYYGKVFMTIDKRGKDNDPWSYDMFTTYVMPTT